MRTLGPFLAGVGLTAVLAAAAYWSGVRPQIQQLEQRALDAQRAEQRALREVGDAQHWAQAERERNRVIDEELATLRLMLGGTPQTPPAQRRPMVEPGPRHDPVPTPPTDGEDVTPPADEKPETWDGRRVRQEIEFLSARAGARAGQDARFPLVVEALRTQGDAGLKLLTDILQVGMPEPMELTALSLIEGLADARAVPVLLERWKAEETPSVRLRILRALGNLPGDEQTPLFVAQWTAAQDAMTRRVAIHGLAMRKDPVALQAARGADTAATRALRMQAIDSLRTLAQQGQWKDADLVPVFADALRTADGESQRKAILLTLEGFWSPAALEALDAFAAVATTPPELASRARKLAESIRAGSPRPADAGIPERDRARIAPAAAPPGPEETDPEGGDPEKDE